MSSRLSAIEDNIFAIGFDQFGGDQCLDHVQIDAALTAARTFTSESKQLQLLTLFEQRLNAAFRRTSPSSNPSRPPAKPPTTPP